MVNVKARVASIERQLAPLSTDLRSFLDLVWTHRKDHQTGTYTAENADVYGLYARAHKNFAFGSAGIQSFFQKLLSMPQLPEIQCAPNKKKDRLGRYLKSHFNAQAAASGFAVINHLNFTRLAQAARGSARLSSALANTFYHFRRNLLHSSDRIYLHTKPLQSMRVMEFVLNRMVLRPTEHPGLSNAKVSAPGQESRYDTIVLYLADTNAVNKALDEIANYQHAGNHVWFLPGNTRTTKAITKHNGINLVGVGTGAEPPVALYKHNNDLVPIPGGSSFGSFRSQLIQAALKTTLDKGEGKPQFMARVAGYFKAIGIDPQQPHKHLNSPEIQYRARVTLQQLQSGKEPSWKIT
ncbi:hypothetical protein SAMN02745866_03219 [Alteromonadaceae bacterium Bs31]|nr:hypothetical protein SAMN02745866_03219 [Alteromonadaceae bacterium Bs31]